MNGVCVFDGDLQMMFLKSDLLAGGFAPSLEDYRCALHVLSARKAQGLVLRKHVLNARQASRAQMKLNKFAPTKERARENARYTLRKRYRCSVAL